MKKLYVLFFLFIGICATGYAQDFFADEAEDTIPKKFYEQERSVSLFYTLGYPNDYVGFSAFIHNNKDKFSFYIGARTNVMEQYYVTGYTVDSSASVRQLSHFNQTTVTVGLGGAIKPDLLLYVALGTTYRYTSLNTQQYADRGVLFTNPKNKFSLACDAGLMYILPIGLSFQAGADIFNSKLVVGVGYTF